MTLFVARLCCLVGLLQYCDCLLVFVLRKMKWFGAEKSANRIPFPTGELVFFQFEIVSPINKSPICYLVI